MGAPEADASARIALVPGREPAPARCEVNRTDEPRGPEERRTNPAARAPADFPTLLRRQRERAGLSQNALAERAGRDPGTINRLESGKRAPVNRGLLADLARALGLSATEHAALLAAAGHVPEELARVGLADSDLRLVAEILADETIPPTERGEFRLALRLAARRWRQVGLDLDRAADPREGRAPDG